MTMSDIQVTRRDREMAERAELGVNDEEFARGQASLSEEARACREHWLDTGGLDFAHITRLHVPRHMADQLGRVERIARGYAQARAEGVASERARWLADARGSALAALREEREAAPRRDDVFPVLYGMAEKKEPGNG